jgi:hypothetical protein
MEVLKILGLCLALYAGAFTAMAHVGSIPRGVPVESIEVALDMPDCVEQLESRYGIGAHDPLFTLEGEMFSAIEICE